MHITPVIKQKQLSTVPGYQPANLVVSKIKTWYPLGARQYSLEMRPSELFVVLEPMTLMMKSATLFLEQRVWFSNSIYQSMRRNDTL